MGQHRMAEVGGAERDALVRSMDSYGRLSICALAVLAGASSISLLFVMAWLLTSARLLVGPPYADVAAATIAMGGAAALATLASASAYLSQYARHSGTIAREAGSRWLSLASVLHAATFVLVATAYLAFAVGGLVFIHFCLATMRTLAQIGSVHGAS